MATNIPVYEFLGYKLIKANYTRDKDTDVQSFSIKTYNRQYDNEKKIFSFLIQFILQYKDTDISEFIFVSAFKINDLDWKNNFNDNILESLFMTVTFPYIRQKITSITDDSRKSLTLPIIDLRNIDLTQGALYISNNNSNKG
jgi:preprotein translocase subunit SecB